MVGESTAPSHADSLQQYLSWDTGIADTGLQCTLLSDKLSIKKFMANRVEDQLFLTLMKRRQAKDDIELSIKFGCSVATVSRLMKLWIDFKCHQLKNKLTLGHQRMLSDNTCPVILGNCLVRHA